ncbi:MAG: rod shape-determining protein RodA, partial [Patescibacteria group bacterium]
IYSLVFNTNQSELASRQGLSAVIGLLAMMVAAFSDYRLFRGTSWIFYIISIILLVLVDLFGKEAGGARNWLIIGPMQLQPSEVSKAAIILTLSSFFSGKIGNIRWRDLLVSLLIILPSLALILREPDLGTVSVIIFIYFTLVFLSRPTRTQNITILALIVGSIAVLFVSAFAVPPFQNILKDYQRNRIMTFVSPTTDPYGHGYNVRQAQITIGSGGIFGKGLGHGTQSQLRFLPEPHTDFIFAGIAESFGFMGSAVFLLLYTYLIWKLISIASLAQDNFGMLVCFGVAAMLMFQAFVNVGMNAGLVPVTGIPLPFLSYGGSSLIVSLALLGLTQSIFIRHKKISF